MLWPEVFWRFLLVSICFLYMWTFFNLPDTVYHSYMNTRISGMGIAVGTGLLAVYLGVRGILKITPAQAMRQRLLLPQGI